LLCGNHKYNDINTLVTTYHTRWQYSYIYAKRSKESTLQTEINGNNRLHVTYVRPYTVNHNYAPHLPISSFICILRRKHFKHNQSCSKSPSNAERL